jgi:nitrate/nitrite-specific signal transduction histidine kinase
MQMTFPAWRPGDVRGRVVIVGAADGVNRWNLQRLRWVGVAIPLAALLVAETLRYLIPGNGEAAAVHVLWGAAAGSGIVIFALLMFWWIGRSEREIVRQNRELGAVNAVSKAVQDQESSQDAIEAALASLVEATRARKAAVRIFSADGAPALEPAAFEVQAGGGPEPGTEPIELPLSTGSAVVGLLQVWLPRQGSDESISGAALQNISHQLGCAIQLRRLVDDLQRRQHEASALYDVAILISDQQALADVLAQIMRTVRELLAVDEVAICLTPGASAVVIAAASAALAAQRALSRATDGAICVTLGPEGLRPAHEEGGVCSLRSSPEFRHIHEVPIRGADATLGDVWVGRRLDKPFDLGDRTLLAGLADLASIAITSTRLRERDRLAATVAERERIARELHDSLAQVLGVTHLRLRAVGANPAVARAPDVARELSDLAELSHEAYVDVREAILGLRESSRLDRGFVPSLAAYLEKFSRQSGVQVTLDARLGRDPDLAPESEIQLIRVIQEALANVRKHAGAERAVVRLLEDAGWATIQVEDDGRGFDVAEAKQEPVEGFGLETMRERIELVGGCLTIESTPGLGTVVTVRVPKDGAQAVQEEGERAVEAVAPRAPG